MGEKVKKNTDRIWELDALRGLCIICVCVIHTIFDIQYLFGEMLNMPAVYNFIQEYGGAIFVFLSGICVTLGHHNIKRGLIVLAGALAITVVTLFMGDSSVLILFGVLHLIAFCMITYSIYRKWPAVLVLVIGILIAAAGIYIEAANVTVTNPYLFPLGLHTARFQAGDYFPIMPHLGYFMIGTFIGKTVYKNRKTIFPGVNANVLPIRFLSFCGRQSLIIYLAQQPVCFGICELVYFFINGHFAM